MILYNENNEEVIFDLRNSLLKCSNNGSCSNIYKISDYTCLKLLHDYFVIDSSFFKDVINLHLNGLYEVYEILYDKYGKTRGYLMRLYKTIDLDLISNKDYLIDNYLKLVDVIRVLSEHRIDCKDLYKRNTLLTKDGMIIIDIDLYDYNYRDTLNNILSRNTFMLNRTFGKYLDDDCFYKYNLYSSFEDGLFNSISTDPIKVIMDSNDIKSLIKR